MCTQDKSPLTRFRVDSRRRSRSSSSMGLFGKKKKEATPEPEVRAPSPAAPANPFPDSAPRYNPYAEQETFVPREVKARETLSQDPLEAAAQRKRQRDEALLDAIFHAFARMLPQYGAKMKDFATLTTTDYAFNEGEYSDRYDDLERMIERHMEAKGWKVKKFKIKDSNERSKSTLNKYYPRVKWHVLEPGKTDSPLSSCDGEQ